MTAQTATKTLLVELPEDVATFLKDRKAALGASYKGTLTAAVRHYRDATEAPDKAARQPHVEALAKVMTDAAVKAATADQPKTIAARVEAAKEAGKASSRGRKSQRRGPGTVRSKGAAHAS